VQEALLAQAVMKQAMMVLTQCLMDLPQLVAAAVERMKALQVAQVVQVVVEVAAQAVVAVLVELELLVETTVEVQH